MRSLSSFGCFGAFFPDLAAAVCGLFGDGPYPDDSPGFLCGDKALTGLAVAGLDFDYLTVLPPSLVLLPGELKFMFVFLLGVANDDISYFFKLMNKFIIKSSYNALFLN